MCVAGSHAAMHPSSVFTSFAAPLSGATLSGT
jgi:hypothetical protein